MLQEEFSIPGIPFPCPYALGFLEIFKAQAPNGLPVRIAPLINIPKGFSSKMTLEVAKIDLKASTQYMLQTHLYA